MSKRVAVLISGSGSNLQALIDAVEADKNHPAEIALVVSNKADAYGLERAAFHNIEACVLDNTQFDSRESYDAAMHDLLESHAIDLVCLAGFMRLLTAPFVDAWHGRMLNIHPSLLPSFKGLHTHRNVLEAGIPFTGCTVHFVTPDMDAGPIILQAAVPVEQNDTEDSLAKRVLTYEHQCYPQALRWVAEGRITLENNHVKRKGAAEAAPGIIHPLLD